MFTEVMTRRDVEDELWNLAWSIETWNLAPEVG